MRTLRTEGLQATRKRIHGQGVAVVVEDVTVFCLDVVCLDAIDQLYDVLHLRQ